LWCRQADITRGVEAFIASDGAKTEEERRHSKTLLEPAVYEMKRMVDSNLFYNFKKTPKYQVAVGYLLSAT
jgi:hypothetical protein